ncbi:MAG: efflux RND transporter periplasmic adaptor subunit [Candidatus Riflebacteria bacterium]|nr:efflux RND transporter periplasmic adaptor subunit [Candidatus Riflebacteria bacterium]
MSPKFKKITKELLAVLDSIYTLRVRKLSNEHYYGNFPNNKLNNFARTSKASTWQYRLNQPLCNAFFTGKTFPGMNKKRVCFNSVAKTNIIPSIENFPKVLGFLLLFLAFFQSSSIFGGEKTVVTTIFPKISSILWTEKTTGELIALRRTSLQMRNHGTLEKLFAQEGERVQKGQLLARLELITFQLGLDSAEKALEASKAAEKAAGSALEVAKSGVKQAEVRLETATKEYTRATSLKEKGSVTQQAYDQSEGNFKMAQVGLEVAKKQVLQSISAEALARSQYDVAEVTFRTAKKKLDESSLFSPFDGLVVSRPIQEHETIGDNAVLFTLIDDSELELSAKMPERYLQFVKPGTPFSFKSELCDETINASVSLVIPSIDSVSRTFIWKSFLGNSENKLRHGSFVDVNVVLKSNDNAVTLPIEAVRINPEDKSKGTIFVAEKAQNKENVLAKEIPVTLGIEKSGQIEITAGLDSKASVILHGLDKVSNGTPVEISEGGKE